MARFHSGWFLFENPISNDATRGPSDGMIALRATSPVTCEQVAVIVSDVRLLVGPPSCTSPLTSRRSHHVSSPYFKQLILGLWLDFCFTNFLDFNCGGYYDGALPARAKGFTFCVHNQISRSPPLLPGAGSLRRRQNFNHPGAR